MKMMSNERIKTITLGCRLNFCESELLKNALLKKYPNDDVVLVNTCAVTHEAERQSRQIVRKVIRENVGAKIVVTGCAAELAREYFEELAELVEIMPNADKVTMEELPSHIPEDATFFDGKARAFLQIQNGCDHFCTFCIVPFTRGRSVSLQLHSILQSLDYCIARGFKEVVISGVDIASFGKDLEGNFNLVKIVEMILEHSVCYNTRIRLSSLDPAAVDRDLLHLISREPRIMPYLHLSVQSGSNFVLKQMQRRHSREDVINICEELRQNRNEMVIGADLIAGFPTETDTMFDETLHLIDEAEISLIHAFPYSVRSGTVASRLINLPKAVVQKRTARLLEKANVAKRHKLCSLVGTITSGMIEKCEGDIAIGKTDSFIPFRITGSFEMGDVIESLRVVSYSETGLICKLESPRPLEMHNFC
jgi:threonylcarbamoyladenosine tRNA methylthiotransferase MtaB